MNSQGSERDPLIDKGVRLYKFLLDLVRSRTSVVYDATNSVDVLWLDQIPKNEKYCNCANWVLPAEAEKSSWITIKRPMLPTVPSAPEICKEWVNVVSLGDYQNAPSLFEKIIKEKSPSDGELNLEPEYLVLESFPEVAVAWNEYLENFWKPWSKEYASLKEIQDIYSRLFNMYQQQKALGESYEVVLGLGLLKFMGKKGGKVFRHILTARCDLAFESNRGTIVVDVGAEGAKLQFETDMLDPDERPPVEIQQKLEESLGEVGDQVWDRGLIEPIIRSWIHSLDPRAVYHETSSPLSKSENQAYPEVAFAPALILRKRMDLGLLKIFEKIIDQLQQEGKIPGNVKRFLSIEEERQPRKQTDVSGEAEQRTSAGESFSEEILFPLPFNEEQLKIIRELNKRDAVLVQGPPGTGKSHTIANLICHCLSQGKRVLVTSQTARALKVLKQKLPKQIQSLCVSVLGNQQEDLDGLRGAVAEITEKRNSWDEDVYLGRINASSKKFEAVKKEIQELTVSLREVREKETYQHTIVDRKFHGTAAEIAQQLKRLEGSCGWLDDEISPDELCPLSNSQFAALVDLVAKFPPEHRRELALRRISSKEVLSTELFIKMVENEQHFKNTEKQIKGNLKLSALFERFKNVDPDKRRDLLEMLAVLQNATHEARRRPLLWLKEAVCAILGDQDQPLKDLAEVTTRYLNGLKEKAIEADDCSIVLPEKEDIYKILADARELFDYFNTGRSLGFGIFRPKIYRKVKHLFADVKVNGRTCENIECLKLLINRLETRIALTKLRGAWQHKQEIPEGTFFSQVSLLSEQLEALEVVLSVEGPLYQAKAIFRDIKLAEPPWHEVEEIDNLVVAIEGTFIIDEMQLINTQIDRVALVLKSILAQEHHGVNQSLLDALESRDWSKWGKALSLLINLEKDKSYLEECESYLECLAKVAPIVSEEVASGTIRGSLNEKSSNFEESWAWLRGDAWLRDFEKTHDEYQLQRDYEEGVKERDKIVGRLAAAKAWQLCFQAMGEVQRQHLIAWKKSIERIGKGKGKHAEKYKREAAANFEHCRSAIPAWIMPIYRVTESIMPSPEIFDVVIIDEASQSGPEALFLFYLAKKIIIVGDDEQIRPKDVFENRANIELLIKRHISDLPHPNSFDVQSSLFSHAEIRCGSRVALREHFRCVPEIIEFSNRLCYAPNNTPLIPLRSSPPERLDPVRHCYVKGGVREGEHWKALNRLEAEVLVNKIVELCKRKEYKNRTMGVITLQRGKQAQYIDRLLVEQLGPKEMEERRLISGGPYDFQGDERDVIFLSLVAGSNTRIGALARETTKREFNVAVSRAKDQIWLFHSVTENDLSPKDYRHTLLTWFQKPEVLCPRFSDVGLENIRNRARTAKRNREDPPDPFESWFEVDVFLQIIDKGYKVIPQFTVANKRIDLVVEGRESRLAVECDGDKWHGPEEYEQDQWRERMLRRAGWRFWRIRGSAFYHDPEHSLDPLWQVLDEMRIDNQVLSGSSLAQLSSPQEQEDKEREAGQIEEGIPLRGEVKGGSFDYRAEDIVVRDHPETDSEDRLSAVVEHAKKQLEMKISGISKLQFRETTIKLLKEGSQGKDLIADKVLRELGFTGRGRIRNRLRIEILRMVSDLKREGKIEQYETNKRVRLRLIDTLFDTEG